MKPGGRPPTGTAHSGDFLSQLLDVPSRLETLELAQSASDARVRRAAASGAIYRQLNDELGNLSRTNQPLLVCCECKHMTCSATITIDREEYERVRQDSLCFILIPGHDDPQVEDVTERATEFVVVRKHPQAAEIAQMSDRRRDPRC